MERNISNTEDRRFWLDKGMADEELFVRDVVPQIGINLIVHPMKESDPTYIDLLNTTDNSIADVKHQTTPFFSSYMKYKMEPRYTVTFNRKDYEHYYRRFPEANIYWWVEWKQLNYDRFNVEPLNGVWVVKFKDMAREIELGKAPLHSYQNRVNDCVNAKDSYLFDLRKFTLVKDLNVH